MHSVKKSVRRSMRKMRAGKQVSLLDRELNDGTRACSTFYSSDRAACSKHDTTEPEFFLKSHYKSFQFRALCSIFSHLSQYPTSIIQSTCVYALSMRLSKRMNWIINNSFTTINHPFVALSHNLTGILQYS